MGAEKRVHKPTAKQLLWYSHYINESNPDTFLNGVQSALLAYNTESYGAANQMAVDTKKALAPMLDKWFDEEMFSEKALKNKVRKLMNATETKFIKIKGKVDKTDMKPGQRVVCVSGSKLNEGGEDEIFVTEETLIAVDQGDNSTQRATAHMALQIKGMYAADKVHVTGLDELAGRLASAKKRTSTEGAQDTPEGLEDDDLFS